MRVAGLKPTPRGTADLSRQPRRHELVFAVLQPAHGAVLHPDLGELFVRVRQSAGWEFNEGRSVYVGGVAALDHRRARGPQQITRKESEGFGAVRAFDPKTGEKKWEFKMADVTDSGILTTASDLLFSGGREGYFLRWMRAPASCCGRPTRAGISRWVL